MSYNNSVKYIETFKVFTQHITFHDQKYFKVISFTRAKNEHKTKAFMNTYSSKGGLIIKRQKLFIMILKIIL